MTIVIAAHLERNELRVGVPKWSRFSRQRRDPDAAPSARGGPARAAEGSFAVDRLAFVEITPCGWPIVLDQFTTSAWIDSQ